MPLGAQVRATTFGLTTGVQGKKVVRVGAFCLTSCVPGCGVVWCGVVQCGAVRCGAVRCGGLLANILWGQPLLVHLDE